MGRMHVQTGSQAIVDTLIAGMHKFGGRLALGFHVTSILSDSYASLDDAASTATPAATSTAVPSREPAVAAAAGATGATASSAVRSVATGAIASGDNGSSAFGWPTGLGVGDGAKAGGIELRAADGSVHSVRARQAVICNASVWDTVGLLDAGGLRGGVRGRCAAEVAEEATLRARAAASGNGAAGAAPEYASTGSEGEGYVTDEEFEEYVRDLEMNESMMHLHVGFTARDGAASTRRDKFFAAAAENTALSRAPCLFASACGGRPLGKGRGSGDAVHRRCFAR